MKITINQLKEAFDSITAFEKIQYKLNNEDLSVIYSLVISKIDPKKKKISTEVFGEVDLPTFIKKETWNAFLEMRKSIKKPLLKHGQLLLKKKLYDYYVSGADPNECLEQSILNCWQDVYLPKTNNYGTDRRTQMANEVRSVVTRYDQNQGRNRNYNQRAMDLLPKP